MAAEKTRKTKVIAVEDAWCGFFRVGDTVDRALDWDQRQQHLRRPASFGFAGAGHGEGCRR